MASKSQPPLWQDLLDESLQQARKTSDVLRYKDTVNHSAQSVGAYVTSSPQDVFTEMQMSPVANSAGPSVGSSEFRRFSTVFTPSEMPLLAGHDTIDSFHSPMNDPAMDEFAVDPGYLASQQELRSLMFNTAQSAVPSQANSPMPVATIQDPQRMVTDAISEVVNSKKCVLYLKNYIDVVARWASQSDAACRTIC